MAKPISPAIRILLFEAAFRALSDQSASIHCLQVMYRCTRSWVSAKLIEAAGAKLIFLPPCNPDLNLIETAFSQIKSHLRKKAARAKRELNHAIASAIDLATPGYAVNHYASCGCRIAST